MIVRVAEDGPQYEAVLSLSKTAKQTVGFLPNSAFAQRARQGTLLAALDGDRAVGYALFDLPRQDIRLVHLVVDPASRGGGHARALMDAIAERFGTRRGIRLSCRNDYDAASFWPRVGFVPVGERTGRSLNGHPLTLWWRSFHHADLLSLLHEEDDRPTAVLDSCTFFDVVAPRPPGYIAQLSADWLTDHVHLGVTGEVLVEIARGKDVKERARQRVRPQNVAAGSERLIPGRDPRPAASSAPECAGIRRRGLAPDRPCNRQRRNVVGDHRHPDAD